MVKRCELPSHPGRRQALLQLSVSLVSANLLGASALGQADQAVLDLWQRQRAQWLLNPRVAYFDTATLAPSMRAVMVNHYRMLEQFHSDPQGFLATRCAAAPVQDLLARLGQFIGAEVNEVCGVRSATDALCRAAEWLPLLPGDEVVLASQLPDALHDYWQKRARREQLVINVVHLPMPIGSREQVLEAFAAALNERTRVLCVSQVQALDGSILPVAELCALARQAGVLSLVDGSLAIGALPVSMRELGCDLYAANLCLWLQAAAPCAVLFVRSEIQARWPMPNSDPARGRWAGRAGWPRLQQRFDADFIDLAVQLQSLPIALSWQHSLGRDTIENRLRQLQTYLRINVQGMSEVQLMTCHQPGMQLHLLCLNTGRVAPVQVAEWLQRNDNVAVGVASSMLAPDPLLRIAVNVGNSLDDIDRLVHGLRRALRS